MFNAMNTLVIKKLRTSPSNKDPSTSTPLPFRILGDVYPLRSGDFDMTNEMAFDKVPKDYVK